MNEAIENVVPWLEVLEGAIYETDECPSSFEKKFCDGNELLDVYFTSESIKVYYLLSSGAHVTNIYPINEFNNWLEE